MGLFSKKKDIPPPPAPPPLPVQPTPPAKEKTDSALKLELPNVFAYDNHETKAKTARRSNLTTDETEATPSRIRGSILLVESNEEVSRLISRLLQHEGFNVLKASCLAQAREMMKEMEVNYLLARRQCVPLNLQTEIAIRDLKNKTTVRIVDDFSELMLGQVVDYESMAQSYFGLTDLMISLLEGANVGIRGHAHTVAKYCRLVGQRMGISRRELDAVTLAALVHDLGSIETRHQIGEPLFSRNELLPAAVRSTLEMLSNIVFPYELSELISAASATGDAIPGDPVPRAAHILRVADAFDSLRRALTDGQDEDVVFDQMRRQPEGTFDLAVLETFIHLRKNERAISAMNIFWAAVLLVAPHPDELRLLRLRLENDDFHVLTARSIEEALQQLRRENISLVLTENLLQRDGDGFELLRTMKADPALRPIPVVFHAPSQTDEVKQALEAGAEDWLGKPHNIEIVAMKLQRIVQRIHANPTTSNEGVRGNLRDMGIIEMVQILCSGGRSVQIFLENGKDVAELVLHKGQIIAAAAASLSAELAVLEILGWREGQFRILPLSKVPPVTVLTSTDNLLLQSCIQHDEKIAQSISQQST